MAHDPSVGGSKPSDDGALTKLGVVPHSKGYIIADITNPTKPRFMGDGRIWRTEKSMVWDTFPNKGQAERRLQELRESGILQ